MKILLALFVCLFVPLANWCEARVIVNVGAAPLYGPAPAVSYVPEPTAGYIAPAPMAAPMATYYSAPVVRSYAYSAPMVRTYSYAAPVVTYQRSYAVRSFAVGPAVGVSVGAATVGAQRRHAVKSAKHVLRAAEHAAKAAYWASRS